MSTQVPINRRKILRINDETVLEIIRESSLGKYLNPEVPDGVRTVGVWWEHSYRAFDIVICHESFEEVPEGECPPIIKANCRNGVPVIVKEATP